jgi:hypothetical protein
MMRWATMLAAKRCVKVIRCGASRKRAAGHAGWQIIGECAVRAG